MNIFFYSLVIFMKNSFGSKRGKRIKFNLIWFFLILISFTCLFLSFKFSSNETILLTIVFGLLSMGACLLSVFIALHCRDSSL